MLFRKGCEQPISHGGQPQQAAFGKGIPHPLILCRQSTSPVAGITHQWSTRLLITAPASLPMLRRGPLRMGRTFETVRQADKAGTYVSVPIIQLDDSLQNWAFLRNGAKETRISYTLSMHAMSLRIPFAPIAGLAGLSAVLSIAGLSATNEATSKDLLIASAAAGTFGAAAALQKASSLEEEIKRQQQVAKKVKVIEKIEDVASAEPLDYKQTIEQMLSEVKPQITQSIINEIKESNNKQLNKIESLFTEILHSRQATERILFEVSKQEIRQ